LPERILQEQGKIDMSSFRGAFDPTWQLQGLKVVYLYAQRLHGAHSLHLFGGFDLTKINPNDSDAEVECPEILPCPCVPVAELPQPPPVQPHPALHHQRGERGAVAQLETALVRTHGEAHLSEPNENLEIYQSYWVT